MFMFSDLNEKEKSTLQYIANTVNEKGYPPSVREICKSVGFKSTSTAYACLNQLKDKGYIRKDSVKTRALEVIDPIERMGFAKKNTVDIPIIGKVTAGTPILAVENVDDYIPISEHWINSKEHFLLRVEGDSMINAGIYNNDIVLIEQCQTASNGDIVVALIDGEYTTIKRFFYEKNRICLKPENEKYSAIFSDNIKILGNLKMLIRKFD